MTRAPVVCAWVALAASLYLGPGQAHADVPPPPAMDDVGIDERLGERLPLDLAFMDGAGRPVRLADLFGDGKPVVLSLAYFSCPMLCGLTLNGTVQAFRGLDWRLGGEYRAVTISFDPKDRPADAEKKQSNTLAAAGRPDARAAWPFLVGDAETVARLIAAVGFRTRRDERSGQIAHPSALVVVSPDGTISRYLYGVEYPPVQLKLALLDAAGGKVGSVVDKVILTCFRWDPATRQYGLFVTGFLRVGAGLVLLSLVTLVVVLLRLERRRRATP